MASLELLRPSGPPESDPSYTPTIIQATVLTGSEGSVVGEEATLVPTGYTRVRARISKEVDKNYFVRLFGTIYRIVGIRPVAPNGLFSDILLEIVDDELRIADFVTIKGQRVTIKGQAITI